MLVLMKGTSNMGNQMHVFTKQGDSGQTRLYNGTPVDKDHMVIVTNGHIDELTSHIGIVKAQIRDSQMIQQLEDIQKQLIHVMGYLAGLENSEGVQTWVGNLEGWIVAYESSYPRQRSFVLPGKTPLSAELDVVRTVCRRAERSFMKVSRNQQLEAPYQQYMNRLSDYFHVSARYIEFASVIEKEVLAVMKSTTQDKPMTGSIPKKAMSLDKASRVIDKVKEKASAMGLKVVVAVASREGHPIAVQVMDDAYIASYDIAVNKAYTAVSLKMATDQLSELAKPDGPLYGIQHTNGGRIVIFGGGVPLTLDGEIVGGLGVSGGSAEEDSELANYGLNYYSNNF